MASEWCSFPGEITFLILILSRIEKKEVCISLFTQCIYLISLIDGFTRQFDCRKRVTLKKHDHLVKYNILSRKIDLLKLCSQVGGQGFHLAAKCVAAKSFHLKGNKQKKSFIC